MCSTLKVNIQKLHTSFYNALYIKVQYIEFLYPIFTLVNSIRETIESRLLMSAFLFGTMRYHRINVSTTHKPFRCCRLFTGLRFLNTLLFYRLTNHTLIALTLLYISSSLCFDRLSGFILDYIVASICNLQFHSRK